MQKKETKLLESGPSESNDSSVEKDFTPDVAEKETDRERLNENLTSVKASSLKLHAVAAPSKVSAGKRKLREAKTALRKKIASTLNLEDNILTSESSDYDKEIKRKASSFDRLMKMIKDKLPHVNHRKQIQMLILVPES